MTVVVISTGGTIASTPNEGEGTSPVLSGEDLIAAVPQLEAEVDIETHDFSNIPSPQLRVGQMMELVEAIKQYDAQSDIDGIVVTQGTDILEETAYFVDCCYGGKTPVVFTGAMRNPSLPSPDGPANLLASVRTTLEDITRSQGIFVTFNDRIHAAKDVTKMHSMNVDTFRSPEFGPLAVHDEGRIRWQRSPDRNRMVLDPETDRVTNAVAALTVTADMPAAYIPSPSECAAVCFAATGAGHIPPTIISALSDLADAGVPLIATTRCPEGRLARSTYSFRGSEQTLQELGCYFSERNLQKTRMETIAALAADSLADIYDQPGPPNTSN